MLLGAVEESVVESREHRESRLCNFIACVTCRRGRGKEDNKLARSTVFYLGWRGHGARGRASRVCVSATWIEGKRYAKKKNGTDASCEDAPAVVRRVNRPLDACSPFATDAQRNKKWATKIRTDRRRASQATRRLESVNLREETADDLADSILW